MKKLFTVLALIAGLASAAGAALAETRVALVIGNDEYVTLPNLNNAGNDVRGVAAKLKHRLWLARNALVCLPSISGCSTRHIRPLV